MNRTMIVCPDFTSGCVVKTRRAISLALVAALLIPGVSTHAQQTTPAREADNLIRPDEVAAEKRTLGDDETIVLNPFTVSGSKDLGYQATTTLAGSRIRTDLADVGSSISVLTKEFMDDIGGKSNETVLAYATNTEVGGPRGNFSGGVPRSGSYGEQGLFSNPNGNTRVRGLTSADNTRNYFLTDAPWDGYTISRVDLQRGPNAILFGLGSPSGVINATTNDAEFYTRGQVQAEFDKHGSARFVFDYNDVLIKDELAMRATVLKNNQKFRQDPAFSNDTRFYGALKYRPKFLNQGRSFFEISGDYENGKIRSNRPRQVTPGDYFTGFWDPESMGGAGKKTFNFLTQDLGNEDSPFYTQVLGGSANGGNYDQLVNSKGSTVWVASAVSPWGALRPDGSVIDRTNDEANGPWPRANSLSRVGLGGTQAWAGRVGLPFSGIGAYRNRTLTDSSVFDFYNNLIDGPNKKEWTNWNVFDVNVSHTFLDNALGYNLAYFNQKLNRGQWTALGWDSSIRMDVNEVGVDTLPNPDIGRAFIALETRDFGSYTNQSDRDAFRAQLFGEYDFDKKHDGLWARILGVHRLTGVASQENQKQDSRDIMLGGLDMAARRMFSPDPVNEGGPYPGFRYYISDDLRGRASASGANLNTMGTPFLQEQGGQITIRRFDNAWTAGPGVNPGDPWVNPYDPDGTFTQSNNPANYRGWVNTPVNYYTVNSDATTSGVSARDYLTTTGRLQEFKVRSKIGVWQGYFWDKAIIGIYGYRKDTARSYTYISSQRNGTGSLETGSADLRPGTYNFNNPKGDVQDIEATSKNWSVAVHLNRLLGKHDFLPINVSLYYNEGENFQPLAGRIDAFGRTLAPPKGTTNERSVLLATKNNKYSFRMTKYETTVLNSTSTDGQLAAAWALEQTLGFTATLARDFRSGRVPYSDYSNAGGDAARLQNVILPAWFAFEKELKEKFPDFVSGWMGGASTSFGTDSNAIVQTQVPAGFTNTEDSVSKGYEFEFTANPTPNWRIAANASRTKAVRDNVPGSLREVMELLDDRMQNSDVGLAPVWWSGNVGGGRAVGPYAFNGRPDWLRVNALNGQSAGEIRKWRFNVITNYTFNRGFAKGFSVGGGYRWEDRSVIGYAPIRNTDGSDGVNINAPFYAPAEKNTDLWIGYSRKLTNKIDWKIQLNVYNVFGKNELVPFVAGVDSTKILSVGAITPTTVIPMRGDAFLIREGLSWQISNTFTF